MQAKKASAGLCSAIAGTLTLADFNQYEKVATVSAELLADCPYTLTLMKRATAGGIGNNSNYRHTAKVASAHRVDVLQVRPSRYGYTVKWAAAPDGVQPQQAEMSVPEAQQAVPQQMLQSADQQGVATTTSVQATPDPLQETPSPVTGFGLYKVRKADTAEEIVGYVIPMLLDPQTGQQTPTHLFTNGSEFCLQPDIAGVMVGVNYNLPGGTAEPRGLGVFYKANEKAIVATVPFTVVTAIHTDGRKIYAAQNQMGAEIQIVPSDGLQQPMATNQNEVSIPSDYKWLPLNQQIQLAGTQQDPMAQAKTAMADTSATIRAWTTGNGRVGGVRLSGPVFEKCGSGTHSVEDAIFYLAAAGMQQNLAIPVIEKAASIAKPITFYGMYPLSTDSNNVKEAMLDAFVDTSCVMRDVPKVCLLKEAALIEMNKEARDLVGVDSLDTILALGFINPENVGEFVDNIPALEETQTKLAALVFATQLGLQSVQKTAAVKAMTSLEEVIKGLKGLKNYKM